MQKQENKQKALQKIDVQEFYARYKQEKMHRADIVKVLCKQKVYFTTYAQKRTSKISWVDCTLLIYQVNGVVFFAYAKQTKGFPFKKDVDPEVKGNVPVCQISDLKIEDQLQIELIHQKKNDFFQKTWQFKFFQPQVKAKWTLLLISLHYAKSIKETISIDKIATGDFLNYLRLQKKQQDNHGFQTLTGELQLQKQQLIQEKLEAQQKYERQLQRVYKVECQNSKLKERLSQVESKLYQNRYSQTTQNKNRQNLTYDRESYSKQEVDSLRSTIQQLNFENIQLKQKLDNKPLQRETYTANSRQTAQRKLSFEKQLDQRQHALQQFKKRNDIIAGELAAKEEQLRQREQQIQRRQAQLNKQEDEYQLLVSKQSFAQQESNRELQKYKAQAVILNQTRTKFKQTNQNLARQLKSKELEVNSLDAIVKQLQKKNSELDIRLKNITDKHTQMKKQYSQKEIGYQQLLEKLSQKERDIDNIKFQLEKTKYNLSDITNQLNIEKDNRVKLEQELRKFKQKVQQLKRETDRSSTQNTLKCQQIENLQQRIYALNQERQRNVQALNSIQTMRIQLIKFNKLNLYYIFDGDVLEGNLQYTEFLKQSIEKFNGKKIFKTRRLYTLEKDSNANFHKQVDEIPEIAVLVKTEAGFYLAGYSQSPISSKAPASKGGLIISLNNKKVFPLIQGKRSVTYDSFFLIIGNSEIRLKNQEWKVFSNFGIANSFFNNMGCGVNDLLGEGPGAREVKLLTFEVHKIVYE